MIMLGACTNNYAVRESAYRPFDPYELVVVFAFTKWRSMLKSLHGGLTTLSKI